jgi:RNA polymerase sigma factor (sigma-70 family)
VRIVRSGASAQDITQNVFIALAQSAKRLMNRPVLAGWLHQTTRNIAANSVRCAIRRQIHEQEAATMNELTSSAHEDSWEEIAPQIDEALCELSDSDRDALLVRYFQRKTAHEMALTLGISDEAPQERVNRAVERLRDLLSKRNVSTGAAGLALMISAHAVQSAPATFAAGLAGSVLASARVIQSAAALGAGNVLPLSMLGKAPRGHSCRHRHELNRRWHLRHEPLPIFPHPPNAFTRFSNSITRCGWNLFDLSSAV